MAYNLVTNKITQQPTPIRRTGLASPAPVDLTGLGGKPTTGTTAPKSLFMPTPAATTLKPLYGNMIPSKGGFAAITPVTTKPPIPATGGGTTTPPEVYAPSPGLWQSNNNQMQWFIDNGGWLGGFNNGRRANGMRWGPQALQNFRDLNNFFNSYQPYFASKGINTFGDWIVSLGGNAGSFETTPVQPPPGPTGPTGIGQGQMQQIADIAQQLRQPGAQDPNIMAQLNQFFGQYLPYFQSIGVNDFLSFIQWVMKLPRQIPAQGQL